jgi:RNA polymerase sigma-70 factor (sigma-E family)
MATTESPENQADQTPADQTPADRKHVDEDPTPAGPVDFDGRFDELAQVAYRVAFRILGDREDARDVVQETLARAFVRWGQVRGAAPAWVSRVAANQALDLVRRRGRRPDPERPVPSTDPAGTFAERTELVEALRRLPKRQREVVVLRYVADLPEADVAAVLKCSTGTVKRHAHRGIAALRLSLEPTLIPDLEAVL